MLYRALLLSLLFSFTASAAETEKRIAYGFIKVESTKDPSLNKNEAIYKFNLRRVDKNVLNTSITYSIDGKSRNVRLKDGVFVVNTVPGKHRFQVYINSDYYEMYSDSLTILGSHVDSYDLYPKWSEVDIITEKPVIYLYPEKETKVDFKIKIKGDDIFTYPTYNNGWSFTASPNGALKFGRNTYRYLFWDAKQTAATATTKRLEGFIVEGKNATEFLEEKLTEVGLTSEEQADFITYWGPRLASKNKSYVRFIFNDDCTQFATFDITPQPDNVFRIYMIWHELYDINDIVDQQLVKAKRKGFSVIEWGGQEIKAVKRRTQNQINLKE